MRVPPTLPALACRRRRTAYFSYVQGRDAPFIRTQREMKIIDKIQQAMEAKEPFYSFEFFPPKTSAGVENL